MKYVKKIRTYLRAGMVILGTVLALTCAGGKVLAASNGLGDKPYMGWSSYSMQVYTNNGQWITAAQIKAQSDAMHQKLQSHGYNYINVDAGWNGGMDGYGRPIPSTTLYPNGIQDVISYVHANGQKFGVYGIPGMAPQAYDANLPIYGTSYHMQDIAYQPLTKIDYWGLCYKIDFSKPGAQEYINSIAALYASWGVDFLKFDSVTPGSGINDLSHDARDDVRAWSQALAPYHIWFELSWALDMNYAEYWKKYANGWRVDWDIEAYQPGVALTSWPCISRLFNDAAGWWRYAGPGGWNDFDSLDVGNGSMDGLTTDERQTATTLFAISSAQLYTGNDLTNLDSYGLSLLTNDEVIAVNQAGHPGHPVSTSGNQQVWYANNGDGTYSVALFNLGTSAANVTVNWSDIGLRGPASVRDLWAHKDLGTYNSGYTAVSVPAHGSRLFRVAANGGSLTLNDDDTGIRYTGAWSRSWSRGLGDYQDDVRYTQTNGDSFEYTFRGTGVEWITEKDASQGDVDIYLDGVFQQTVSTYATSRQVQQSVYRKTGLSTGSHTLKGVKKTGSYMLVDAIRYYVQSPLAVNDTDTGISYTGAWNLSSSRGFGDYGDDVHYTQTNNDACTYTFSGTGVEFVTEADSSGGNIEVWLDNVLQTTVSAQMSARTAQQTVYRKTGLSNGSHTLRLVKKSGTYMVVDRFNVIPNRIQINDGDAAMTYTGAWSVSTGRGYGDYNDDVHYTQTNNDAFSVTFSGTGVELLTEKDASQGNIDIYIDNVLQTTVNTSATSRTAAQVVYSKTGLSAGTHTLKGVKKTGTFMLVDSVRIIP